MALVEVPLVVYENGERIVLGTATIREDGSIVSDHVAMSDTSKFSRWLLNTQSGHYSLVAKDLR